MWRHVVVIGPMASGKSTIGAALSSRLGRPLRDSDADLAAERGITGRELATREGVDALHEWEADHLRRSLAETRPSVVAAAASTVDDAGARRTMAEHVVVRLTAPPEVLVARMAGGDERRELGDDELRAVTELSRRREDHYREVADIEIDASQRAPGDVVAAVLARLPRESG
jgi:shikimate kinase